MRPISLPSEDIPEFYISVGYLHCVFDYLVEQKVPLDPVLDAIGIQQKDIQDRDSFLPSDAMDIAFDVAAQVTGDPLFGFHASQQLRPTHHGLFGFLILCCQNVTEFLHLYTRYGNLISNGGNLDIEVTENKIFCHGSTPAERPHISRHAVEFNIMGMLNLCRWLGGTNIAPDFLELNYAEETDYTAMRTLAGCEIRFGCPEIKASFSRHYLDRSFMQGDTSMRPMLEVEIQRRLQLLQSKQQQHDPKIARIRQFIADNLLKETPELRTIANTLDESVRSLQRHLSNHNTNYKSLLDEVRKEMAHQHIRNPELTLVDVALILGFSDQSTFQRAFKRWHGMCPGEFRKTMSLEKS